MAVKIINLGRINRKDFLDDIIADSERGLAGVERGLQGQGNEILVSDSLNLADYVLPSWTN